VTNDERDELLIRMDERLNHVREAVLGGEQPGLKQAVEGLQADRNWTWGVGAGVSFIGGLAEYFFHRNK
jgi:hypothetical protein